MKTIIRSSCCFLFVANLLINSAVALDATGHLIVQEIALSQLSDAAKQNVDTLVTELRATRNNGAYDRVSIACWPDDIRHFETPSFATWHFIDIGLSGEGPEMSMAVGDLHNQKENVVTAIKRAVAVLKGGDDPVIKTKAVALALLCHFVGDIHQPLHCTTHYFPEGHRECGSSKTDIGGNAVKIENAKTWRGEKLHSFWDGAYRALYLRGEHEIDLDTQHTDRSSHLRGDREKRVVKHNYSAITHRVSEIATSDISESPISLDVEAWANETHVVGEQTAYGNLTFRSSDACHVKTSLSENYVSAARDIMKKRMKLAGYRLAAVLNDIWK